MNPELDFAVEAGLTTVAGAGVVAVVAALWRIGTALKDLRRDHYLNKDDYS